MPGMEQLEKLEERVHRVVELLSRARGERRREREEKERLAGQLEAEQKKYLALARSNEETRAERDSLRSLLATAEEKIGEIVEHIETKLSSETEGDHGGES